MPCRRVWKHQWSHISDVQRAVRLQPWLLLWRRCDDVSWLCLSCGSVLSSCPRDVVFVVCSGLVRCNARLEIVAVQWGVRCRPVLFVVLSCSSWYDCVHPRHSRVLRQRNGSNGSSGMSVGTLWQHDGCIITDVQWRLCAVCRSVLQCTRCHDERQCLCAGSVQRQWVKHVDVHAVSSGILWSCCWGQLVSESVHRHMLCSRWMVLWGWRRHRCRLSVLCRALLPWRYN